MKFCRNLKYVNTPNTLNTGHFEILKNLKYVNTLNTDHFKISEAKKVKYGIRQIRRIRFFPNLSYNEPYLVLTPDVWPVATWRGTPSLYLENEKLPNTQKMNVCALKMENPKK